MVPWLLLLESYANTKKATSNRLTIHVEHSAQRWDNDVLLKAQDLIADLIVRLFVTDISTGAGEIGRGKQDE